MRTTRGHDMLHVYAGKAPLRLPVSLLSLVVTVLLLIPVAAHPTSRVAECIVAALFLVFGVYLFVEFVAWTRARFRDTENTANLLWGVADMVLAAYFSLAGVGFATWLLDATPAKDDLYVAIDASASRYAVYFGDFFYMTTLVFNSVGLHITGPRPTQIIGQMWVMACSLWGTTVLALFMGIVVMQIRIVRKKNKF